MDTNPLIEKAIRVVGRQADLAAALRVGQQTISKLLYRELKVSAEHALLIEAATDGKVTARALRPDLPWPFNAPSSPSRGSKAARAAGSSADPKSQILKSRSRAHAVADQSTVRSGAG